VVAVSTLPHEQNQWWSYFALSLTQTIG